MRLIPHIYVQAYGEPLYGNHLKTQLTHRVLPKRFSAVSLVFLEFAPTLVLLRRSALCGKAWQPKFSAQAFGNVFR